LAEHWNLPNTFLQLFRSKTIEMFVVSEQKYTALVNCLEVECIRVAVNKNLIKVAEFFFMYRLLWPESCDKIWQQGMACL
jgi:hypothetical protein